MAESDSLTTMPSRGPEPDMGSIAMVGQPVSDDGLIARLRGHRSAQLRSASLRFALGCALGLVPAVWLWASVFEIRGEDVAGLEGGTTEPVQLEIRKSPASVAPDVLDGAKPRGPSEKYKAMLRQSGVGLDPDRLRDANAIARYAYPDAW